MSEITVLIGSRIKECRISKKLSQEELAHIANMHTSHLGAIERGEKSPTIDSIYKISNALGMSFQELFDFDNKPKIADDTYAQKLLACINSMTNEEQKDVYKTVKIMMKWKDKK